jgi:hypothetical protein
MTWRAEFIVYNVTTVRRQNRLKTECTSTKVFKIHTIHNWFLRKHLFKYNCLNIIFQTITVLSNDHFCTVWVQSFSKSLVSTLNLMRCNDLWVGFFSIVYDFCDNHNSKMAATQEVKKPKGKPNFQSLLCDGNVHDMTCRIYSVQRNHS